MPDVHIEVSRFTAALAGGDQDLTTARLQGKTPKAVLFFLNYVLATSGQSQVADAAWMVGAASGATERWVTYAMAEDAVATADAHRGNSDAACIKMLNRDGGGAVVAEADVDSFITDGIRINWAVTPTEAYQIIAVFFAGDDVDAEALTHTGTAAIVLDFLPEVVIGSHIFEPFPTIVDNGAIYAIGAQTFKAAQGGFEQRGAAFTDVSVGTPGRARGVFEREQVHVQPRPDPPGGFSFETAYDNPSTTGMDVVGTASNGVGILALNIGGLQTWFGPLDPPVAAGAWEVETIGFDPQFVMLIMGMFEDYDVVDGASSPFESAQAGAMGVGVFTPRDAHSLDLNAEAGQNPSNIDCAMADVPVMVHDDAGVQAFLASYTQMLPLGFELQFTDADATQRRWFGLAIGPAVAAAEDPLCKTDVWTG